ncbi:putative transposase [Microlunatus phosphovorus NM-1]|uniref:Putative transposase n=1 Tax=Microlunatus phosphovorus (strain ATCC 700054 / DSM 10555 / JCM 9379 / NBRC 101784 / NCIMB 13414 / VKM Ac-1990 / NM-1) TaxID=1032480 RepID=F5XT13_MICPN|nr:IS1380 family transposase [Microlunatus phosphovorus]BAK34885.1 putative transposase [Microlunatus phosphovorus NM-1]
MKACHRVRPVFDDPNLVGCAGLLPALLLGESAGLHELLGGHLSVGSANAAVKSAGVIAGMLTGADSIDDLGVLRHGGMPRLFGDVRAPSTYGTFLRSFTHGHVQQLDAVSSRLLAGLTARVPGLIKGATDPGGIAFVDLDDTIGEVHGYAKQAAAYGYSKVFGLNAMVAVASTPLAAPVIVASSLRKGNTASGSGSARMLTRAVATARQAGVTGRLMGRADSAFYRHDLVTAMMKARMWFSVTARMNTAVKSAIARIGEDAWTPIKYPNAVWEADDTVAGGGYWVSDAEVAETCFVAFSSKKKAQQVPCRLVVRRVRRLQPRASDGSVQGELFAAHRHHAFITNSTLSMVAADQHHRGHAIIEQVIAELKDGPLAHLPLGRYAANAAWLAHAVIAFNLARAIGVLAGKKHARARWATLRAQLINLPGRIAVSGRRLTLHLPRDWAWAEPWQTVFDGATGPPSIRAA